MTKEEFEEVVKDLTFHCTDTLKRKGTEYTQSSNERLKNFYDIARELELDPFKVWYVYFRKHIDAIHYYALYRETKSEVIKSRFIDAINYLFLGWAIIVDEFEPTMAPFQEIQKHQE